MTDGVREGSLDLRRLSGMNLNLLVPLQAILEEASVTRAAERLDMSQPAMSQALAKLRRVLDDEILVRSGGAMVLTPRARAVLPLLNAGLRGLADVVGAPRFDARTDTRTITIAMTTNVAFLLAGAIVRGVTRAAPGMDVRILTRAMRPRESFDDPDVDVLLLPEVYTLDLPRERLYHDRWMVVTRADEPETDAVRLLADLIHVEYTGLMPRPRAPYPAMANHGVVPRRRHLITDNLMVAKIVAECGGVAVCPEAVVRAMPGELGLRLTAFPFPVEPLGVDIVWNPHMSDPGFVEWFREVLRRAAAETVGAATEGATTLDV